MIFVVSELLPTSKLTSFVWDINEGEDEEEFIGKRFIII